MSLEFNKESLSCEKDVVAMIQFKRNTHDIIASFEVHGTYLGPHVIRHFVDDIWVTSIFLTRMMILMV